MNTAKPNTQSGSESSNAMPGSNSTSDHLYGLRKAFVPPEYALVFTHGDLGVVVFREVAKDGVVYMVGFSGKRARPDFNYRFRSIEQAQKHQDMWHTGLVHRAAAKSERKAAKAAATKHPHLLKVGDVLVASWGYEQTNIDYYQVTRLVGKQSVEIRELRRQAEATGFMRGECVPVKGAFIGEPMVKRVNEDGTVKVRSFGVWAHKDEPLTVGGVEVFGPDEFTSYA